MKETTVGYNQAVALNHQHRCKVFVPRERIAETSSETNFVHDTSRFTESNRHTHGEQEAGDAMKYRVQNQHQYESGFAAGKEEVALAGGRARPKPTQTTFDQDFGWITFEAILAMLLRVLLPIFWGRIMFFVMISVLKLPSFTFIGAGINVLRVLTWALLFTEGRTVVDAWNSLRYAVRGVLSNCTSRWNSLVHHLMISDGDNVYGGQVKRTISRRNSVPCFPKSGEYECKYKDTEENLKHLYSAREEYAAPSAKMRTGTTCGNKCSWMCVSTGKRCERNHTVLLDDMLLCTPHKNMYLKEKKGKW